MFKVNPNSVTFSNSFPPFSIHFLPAISHLKLLISIDGEAIIIIIILVLVIIIIIIIMRPIIKKIVGYLRSAFLKRESHLNLG